jgi:hypothetical protein
LYIIIEIEQTFEILLFLVKLRLGAVLTLGKLSKWDDTLKDERDDLLLSSGVGAEKELLIGVAQEHTTFPQLKHHIIETRLISV